jgi:hypothetical protein
LLFSNFSFYLYWHNKKQKCYETQNEVIGILVVSAIAILGYAETTHSESLDNLLLENIEALAAGETGSGGACVGRGSVVCPLTKEGVEHVHIYYSMPH